MNIIDESYRVGVMLARTPEGRTYLEKKEVAEQCLLDKIGDFALSLVSQKNGFFAYQVLNDQLLHQQELPEENRAPFLKNVPLQELLTDEKWQDAVAYTTEFAIKIERMIEQVQLQGSFKEVAGFTMTPKLRNAGLGLETAYQRSGLYDIALLQKILRNKEYGKQLQDYEERRKGIGGTISHYAYCKEARRMMRELKAQGYDAEILNFSENVYLLKDLMEEAIYESFMGGRVTIQSDAIQKVRIKELGRGFGAIALWTEWTPELIEGKDRFVYDVILDGERYNCAMKHISIRWRQGDADVKMLGLLYPKNDVGVFLRESQ